MNIILPSEAPKRAPESSESAADMAGHLLRSTYLEYLSGSDLSELAPRLKGKSAFALVPNCICT